MPKGDKRGQKKKAYVSLADVKLSDYANNSHVGAVRKKAVINGTRGLNFYALEKAWLESEEFKNLDNDDDDEENASVDETPRRGKKKACHINTLQKKNEISGNTYPLDLWFCIGDYIDPEDVKGFAQICKGSHVVSQTYSFWMNLYKRNYQTGKQLPLSLQPHCIERPWCLKARVVQALYHIYPKFTNVPPSSTEHRKLHNLVKNVCVNMWRLKGTGNEWLFYFKFQYRRSNKHSNVVLREKDPPTNWMDLDENTDKDPQVLIDEVNHIPEEDYKILQVQSPSFVAAPLVNGGCLADVKMGLTRDLTKQKLQLTFSFSNYNQSFKRSLSIGSRDCGGNAEVVAFDPVGSVTVLDWWHPRYPSSSQL